jgi:UDP-2,3-diacylglucosamine pyrophosphatase LpxH
VRTLVISDLHLGSRLGRDVLRRPEPLAALLRALDDVDRVVLLGDVVELLEGDPRGAAEVAEPILRAIGARLGPGREVVLVPGNHDGALVRPWVRETGARLTVAAAVPLDATRGLARVASWLAPATVRAHYPGVWLGERVWATHGHYLERHLLPRAGWGIAREPLRRLPRDGATPADYEQEAGARRLARLEARLTGRLPRPLAAALDDLAELLRAATMPRVPAQRVLRGRIAPLTSLLLGMQMRRASIPALARVAHRLEVDADWVIFGHVHRCGPLAGDDPARWTGPGGRPRIANTGSWIYEALLVHAAAPPHPYWPGGAILLDDEHGGGEPRAVGLLDHLDAAALR